MRIAESAGVPLSQFTQRKPVANGRQVSDVSREERMQLLTERMQSLKSGAVSETYSERAQLLSATGAPQQSWVA